MGTSQGFGYYHCSFLSLGPGGRVSSDTNCSLCGSTTWLIVSNGTRLERSFYEMGVWNRYENNGLQEKEV